MAYNPLPYIQPNVLHTAEFMYNSMAPTRKYFWELAAFDEKKPLTEILAASDPTSSSPSNGCVVSVAAFAVAIVSGEVACVTPGAVGLCAVAAVASFGAAAAAANACGVTSDGGADSGDGPGYARQFA